LSRERAQPPPGASATPESAGPASNVAGGLHDEPMTTHKPVRALHVAVMFGEPRQSP
jgi:hypothetical protein